MDKLRIAFYISQSPLKKDTLEPDVLEAVEKLVLWGYLFQKDDYYYKTSKANTWLDKLMSELDKEFENDED